MRNLLFGPATAGSLGMDVGLLILRLIGGLTLAFAHGLGKVPPSEQFLGMLGGMGIPAPLAWGATAAEFLGALLIVVGLLTRPAALLVTLNFAFIFFYVHRDDAFGDKELPLMFLMWGLTLLFTGAGRFSIDAMIRGRDHTR